MRRPNVCSGLPIWFVFDLQSKYEYKHKKRRHRWPKFTGHQCVSCILQSFVSNYAEHRMALSQDCGLNLNMTVRSVLTVISTMQHSQYGSNCITLN